MTPQSMASARGRTPISRVRASKTGLPVIRASYSARRDGKTRTKASTASFQPSGRSAATPPIRNHAGVKPAAGDELNDVHELFPLTEGVETRGHGAHVVAEGAEPDEMVVDPEELAQEDPDELGPLGDVDAGQGLHRLEVGQVVGGARHVVHPVGVGDELVPGLSLADLLDAPVVVADVHGEIDDLFAIQPGDEPHEPVGSPRGGARR